MEQRGYPNGSAGGFGFTLPQPAVGAATTQQLDRAEDAKLSLGERYLILLLSVPGIDIIGNYRKCYGAIAALRFIPL